MRRTSAWRTSNEHRCLMAQGDRPRRPNRGSRCSPGLIRVSPTVCATHSRARTRPSKSWRSTSGGPATRCSGAAPRRWWRRSFRGPSGWRSPLRRLPGPLPHLPIDHRSRCRHRACVSERIRHRRRTGSRWRPPTAWIRLVLLGGHCLGRLTVASNGWWTGSEMARMLQLTDPKLLLGDGQRLHRVHDLIPSRLPVVSFDRDFDVLKVAGRVRRCPACRSGRTTHT